MDMGALDTTIDVILPARGSCKWLRQALDSINAQSRPPDCITLVDDGLDEPDRVHQLCLKLFGGRFRMLANDGKGLSDALNTAISNSTCDWIARMDADDIAFPDRFEKQLEFLYSSNEPSLIGCGAQVEYINEDGMSLGISKNPETWDSIQSIFIKKNCFVHPTLMLRRESLLSVPYRKAFDGAEDIDLVLRLASFGKILNMPSVLLKYRVHSAQSSFANRPRQTVLQELAIRLYYIRCSGNEDPVSQRQELVDDFVAWRLAQAGYYKTRMLLTMLRYVSMHIKGGEYGDAVQLLRQSSRYLDFSYRALIIVCKVLVNSSGALVHEKTPFNMLNTSPESLP
jgi:glycosyltransferase involved in cell wall biosynthesis